MYITVHEIARPLCTKNTRVLVSAGFQLCGMAGNCRWQQSMARQQQQQQQCRCRRWRSKGQQYGFSCNGGPTAVATAVQRQWEVVVVNWPAVVTAGGGYAGSRWSVKSKQSVWKRLWQQWQQLHKGGNSCSSSELPKLWLRHRLAATDREMNMDRVRRRLLWWWQTNNIFAQAAGSGWRNKS